MTLEILNSNCTSRKLLEHKGILAEVDNRNPFFCSQMRKRNTYFSHIMTIASLEQFLATKLLTLHQNSIVVWASCNQYAADLSLDLCSYQGRD